MNKEKDFLNGLRKQIEETVELQKDFEADCEKAFDLLDRETTTPELEKESAAFGELLEKLGVLARQKSDILLKFAPLLRKPEKG